MIEMAEKAGLDMSDAARMARAKEMGFDDKTYYHGTNQNFEEFDPSKFKGRSTTRVGSEVNVNKYPAFAENERVSEFFANKARTPPGVLYPGSKIIPTKLKMENPLIVDMNKVPDHLRFESQKAYDSDSIVHDIALIKEQSLKKAIDGGNDGVIFKNGYDFRPYSGDIVFPLKMENIRSVDAAFDPAKKDSSNILAGAATIGGIGAGAALTAAPQKSYADSLHDVVAKAEPTTREIMDAQRKREEYLKQIDMLNRDDNSIQTPQSNAALSVASGMDKYNKERKKRLNPVLDFILPAGELPVDYMTKLGYGDEIAFKDRLNAVLGML